MRILLLLLAVAGARAEGTCTTAAASGCIAQTGGESGCVEYYQALSDTVSAECTWNAASSECGVDFPDALGGTWPPNAEGITRTAMAINDNGTVVAWGNRNLNSWSGQARAYELVSGAWTQRGSTILAQEAGENFGVGMAISGDGLTMAVGATKRDCAGQSQSGAIYTYRWSGVALDWERMAASDECDFSSALTNSYNGMPGQFSLSQDGNTIAYGRCNHYGGSGGGSIWKATWTGSSWSHTEVVPGDGTGFLGCTDVAISDDGACVAGANAFAANYDPLVKGKLYIWKADTGTVTTIEGPANGDGWGRAVHFGGDCDYLVASGAPTWLQLYGFQTSPSQGQLATRGFIRVYQWDSGSDAWTQRGTDMIGTSSDSKLGTSVRITSDGSTVIAANTPSSARPAEYLKSRGFTYIPLLANYVHSGLIDVDTGGVGGQIDLTPSGHRFVAFNGNAATELREAPVCSTAEGAGGTSGDPHLRLAHGGKADFRGKDGKYFAILSAPGLAFNLMTVDTTHMLTNRLTDWIPKTVYGSFFAAAAFVIRGNSGSVYAVEAVADEDWFTVSSNGNSTRYHSMWKQFKSDGILVLMKQVTLVVEARGWRIEVSKKAIFNKLDGPSKKRLDLVMFPLDDVSKSCFSHGIVGQTFDSDRLSLNGKEDDYHGPNLEVYTTAQAEGAIEGDWREYMLDDKRETKFKYSRFHMNATSRCSPRDATALRATHPGLGISDEESADPESVFFATSVE